MEETSPEIPTEEEVVVEEEDVVEEDVAEGDVAEEDVAEEDVAEEDVAEKDSVKEEEIAPVPSTSSPPPEKASRFEIQAKCFSCGTDSSEMWSRNEDNDIICNSCLIKSERPSSPGCSFTFRKSTRAKSNKTKPQVQPKTVPLKGKNRRAPFKKGFVKAQASVFAPVDKVRINDKGLSYRTGDIVSVVDIGGGTYYAQIRGLLQDQYNQSCAVLTWLLPKHKTTSEKFNPGNYILGPEEDMPRKLDYLRFVCHSPSQYFMATKPILDYEDLSKDKKLRFGFAVTKNGLQVVQLPKKQEKPFDNVNFRGLNMDTQNSN